ncbi:MAG: lysylphosphatidylglycerol synthase domain-containing protein [Vicinamibacterales bacterium]
MPSADPPPSGSLRASLVGVAILLAGAAVLVVTVRQAGWQEIRAGLSAVGGWFAVVVVLGAFRFLARARSWVHCAARVGAAALSSRRAFAAVLAADAVGNLTPLGLLASEPTKVLLLRGTVATGPALTSVALDNAFYAGSVVLMLAAGAWMLVRQTALPDGLRLAAQGVLAAVVIGALAGAWVVRRRPAVLSGAAQLAARVAGRTARTPDVLRDLEARFYGVIGWPPTTLAAVGGWQAAFHAAAVAEVWLILAVLSGGQVSLADAFVLETTGRLVTVLFKVVPFRIGVDEAGAAVVAAAIGVPVPHAVALALVRKLRILVLNAAGLTVLARARR